MQSLDILVDSLRALLQEVGAFLPRLGVALLVLVAGWLLAKAFRLAVVRFLRALNFHVLTERAGIDGFLQQGGTQKDTTDLFGAVAYALAILATLIVAGNSLQLTQVTELLGQILLYVPRLLVALLLIVFGGYFAKFAGHSVQSYCRAAEIPDGELLGRGVQYIVVAFVLLLAVDHLGIGGGLIQQTFLILFGGLVIALALSFGLGGRDRAAALIERWFPRDDEPR